MREHILPSTLRSCLTTAEAATAAEWESVGNNPTHDAKHNVASTERQVACDRSLCHDKCTSADRTSSARSKDCRVSACCDEFVKCKKTWLRTSASRGAWLHHDYDDDDGDDDGDTHNDDDHHHMTTARAIKRRMGIGTVMTTMSMAKTMPMTSWSTRQSDEFAE